MKYIAGETNVSVCQSKAKQNKTNKHYRIVKFINLAVTKNAHQLRFSKSTPYDVCFGLEFIFIPNNLQKHLSHGLCLTPMTS